MDLQEEVYHKDNNFMVKDNKTYVGVVEDNKDPDNNGRIKARIMGVFNYSIPLEDIPWATPWKDLNGNTFNVPEIGKVVIIVFDDGNEDSPEYIYSDHYNINLENKLKKLSDEDYITMKSLLFDHKTQIYVNDTEGLKIDHKYNNINIKNDGIDLNLKDNNKYLNLGDSTAEQQAILGNHFIDWMSKFLESLKTGSLFNSSGPAMPNPSLLKLIVEFEALKDLKFLSHHVNISDNNKINTVKGEDREDTPQYGDKWVSTKEENNLTSKKNDEFLPKRGPKEEFDKPIESKEDKEILKNISPNNLNSPIPEQASIPEQTNQEINNSIGEGENTYIIENKDSIEKIKKIINFLKSKNYKVYNKPNVLNILALRDKDNGVITNKFDETLLVVYIDDSNYWQISEYKITTVPGLDKETGKLPENVNILVNGQYIDQCKIKNIDGYKSYKSLSFNESVVYENNNVNRYNYKSKTKRGNFKVNIKKSTNTGSSESVYNYAKNASQVFKNSGQYEQFIKLCEKQSKVKDTFTYTLCRKSEFDNFNLNET